jgi:hypothetical protein
VRCQLKLEAVEFMPIPEYKYDALDLFTKIAGA